MKAQQEIVRLFYNQGERVQWVQPTWNGTQVGTRLAHGVVHMEANNKPGFYYVRDDLDNRLHLVGWFDLDPVK